MDQSSDRTGLPRRAVLRGMMAAGVASGIVPAAAGSAAAAPKLAATDWAAFDRLGQAAFDQFKLVGAAVAVVSSSDVLHTATFGHRSLQPRRRVTPTTRFRVGSTAKSMTALLAATYVDEGKFGWNTPVVDVWSKFRAPTPALTQSIRVRDLFGMGTGLAEQLATFELPAGDLTARQIVESIVNLEVQAPPETKFIYNNTVFALGGFLPFLADGVAYEKLQAAYAEALQERILDPAGMSGASVGEDPRGVVDDYAVGCGLDLRLRPGELPFGPLGGFLPAGGTLAHVGDMAAWVQLQLREGLSVSGARVVSPANLRECWRGHVGMDLFPPPLKEQLDPDSLSLSYAMGWEDKAYKGDVRFVSHNGFVDGFLSFIGFFPSHDFGFVVLTNMNLPNGGLLFGYVTELLLNQRFGLNQGTAEAFLTLGDGRLANLAAQGRQSSRPDRKAVASWLGCYEGSFRLAWDGSDLVLTRDPRVFQVLALPGGEYVFGSGIVITTKLKLGRDPDDVPHLEILGIGTFRRLAG
jgi:CubicO group peptidase (beta-lactamase class C family)